MQLKKLTLRDFRRFRHHTFEFSPGLNVIRGDNESGKSTLREALALALFQNARGNAQALLAHQTWGVPERPAIALDFELDGQALRLTRDFQARTNRLETLGGEQALTDSRQIEQSLAESLGIRESSQFRSIAWITQRDVTSIADGPSIADQLKRKVTGGNEDEEETEASKVVAKLRSEIGKLRFAGAHNPGPIHALPTRIERLNQAIVGKRTSLVSAEQAQRHLASEQEELAAARATLAAKEGQIASVGRRLALEADLGRATDEESRLEERSDRVRALEGQAEQIELSLSEYARVLAVTEHQLAALQDHQSAAAMGTAEAEAALEAARIAESAAAEAVRATAARREQSARERSRQNAQAESDEATKAAITAHARASAEAALADAELAVAQAAAEESEWVRSDEEAARTEAEAIGIALARSKVAETALAAAESDLVTLDTDVELALAQELKASRDRTSGVRAEAEAVQTLARAAREDIDRIEARHAATVSIDETDSLASESETDTEPERAGRTAKVGPLPLIGAALALLGIADLLALPSLLGLGVLLLAVGAAAAVWSFARWQTTKANWIATERAESEARRLVTERARVEAIRLASERAAAVARELDVARRQAADKAMAAERLSLAAERAADEALRVEVRLTEARERRLATGRAALAEACNSVEHAKNEARVASANRESARAARLSARQQRIADARANAERTKAGADQLYAGLRQLATERAAADCVWSEQQTAAETLARERRVTAAKTVEEAEGILQIRLAFVEREQRRLADSLAELDCSSLADLQERRARGGEQRNEAASLRSELRGLLGDDTLAGIETNRRAATRKAREIREALAEPEMRLVANVDANGYQSLKNEMWHLRATIANREARIPGLQAVVIASQGGQAELHSIDEELADLSTQLVAAREREAMLKLACDVLEDARKATLISAQQVLESRLGGIVADLTNGRYSSLAVSPTNLEISVHSSERPEPIAVALGGDLSQGTVEQIYLAARIALVELLTGERKPPLILDDPFVSFDETRTAAALALCKRLAAERQIILFTKDPAYASYADHVVTLDPPFPRGEGGQGG